METTVQGAWNSIQTLRLNPAKGEMRRMVHQWLEWAAERNVSFVELRQKVWGWGKFPLLMPIN